MDEVQAGSYAAMDWWYGEIRPEFQQAMSILATVISRPKPEMIVIDVGRKGFGAEWGPPQVKNLPGSKVISYGSEEHLKIAVQADLEIKVGDRIDFFVKPKALHVFDAEGNRLVAADKLLVAAKVH